MKLSKLLKTNPNQIAQNIVENFSLNFVDKIEIAGPGFLNILYLTLVSKTFEQSKSITK